jgi:hypothetical protein
MTGVEGFAGKMAIEAAGAVAKKALDEDDETTAALREIAKDLEPFQGAAESYAKRVAVKQALLLKLWRPLARLVGANKEYFETQFVVDLADKTADIPEENLATPQPSVAIPALEGLSYSTDEPNLKEMYLNLLRTAMDDRRSDDAHPSFAGIIKQLSPGEAGLLHDLLVHDSRAIVRVKSVRVPGQEFIVLRPNLLDWHSGLGDVLDDDLLDVFIDNWIRLGLVSVTYTESISGEHAYDWVDQRPEFIRYQESMSVIDSSNHVTFDRGVLRRTPFGLRFLRAVT